MTPADRLQRRRMRTRQRLLDAAERVFAKIGYKEATILDITEAADVSKRTFYLHFDDKEALVEAIALRAFQNLREQVERKSEQDETLPNREDFTNVARSIFEFAQQNPHLMQVIFGEDGSYRLQAITHKFTAHAWAENMRTHCTWHPQAPVPLEILAYAISGVVHQVLSWWINHPNDYTPAQMAAMCASVLFDGTEVNMLNDEAEEEATTP